MQLIIETTLDAIMFICSLPTESLIVIFVAFLTISPFLRTAESSISLLHLFNLTLFQINELLDLFTLILLLRLFLCQLFQIQLLNLYFLGWFCLDLNMINILVKVVFSSSLLFVFRAYFWN